MDQTKWNSDECGTDSASLRRLIEFDFGKNRCIQQNNTPNLSTRLDMQMLMLDRPVGFAMNAVVEDAHMQRCMTTTGDTSTCGYISQNRSTAYENSNYLFEKKNYYFIAITTDVDFISAFCVRNNFIAQ